MTKDQPARKVTLVKLASQDSLDREGNEDQSATRAPKDLPERTAHRVQKVKVAVMVLSDPLVFPGHQDHLAQLAVRDRKEETVILAPRDRKENPAKTAKRVKLDFPE